MGGEQRREYWSCEVALVWFCEMKMRWRWPKTNYQTFLTERWVYSGSTQDCNSESPDMVSHVQFPHSHRGREQKQTLLQREKGRWKGYGKLAESILRKETFFFWRAWEILLLVSQLYLPDEIFLALFFFFFNKLAFFWCCYNVCDLGDIIIYWSCVFGKNDYRRIRDF